jgi:hypothetical protein
VDVTRRRFLSWLAPLAVLPVAGPHVLVSERPRLYALGEPHEAVWAVGWSGTRAEYCTAMVWGRSRARQVMAPYECHFITTDVHTHRAVFDREVRPYLSAQ